MRDPAYHEDLSPVGPDVVKTSRQVPRLRIFVPVYAVVVVDQTALVAVAVAHSEDIVIAAAVDIE
ncbi:MAG: hypothetical protein ACETWG_11455 [Candidatus Neomarinimicrobiota bacterium]